MTWTITTDGNKTTWTAENGTTNTLTANADRTAWTWTRNKNGKVRTSISYPTQGKAMDAMRSWDITWTDATPTLDEPPAPAVTDRKYYNQVGKIISTCLTHQDSKSAMAKIETCRKKAMERGLTLIECKTIEKEALNTIHFLYLYARNQPTKGLSK